MLNSFVERPQWGAFFDRLTARRADVPRHATARLTVIRPDGDALAEDLAPDGVWLPFNGVTWDKERQMITVALEGFKHRIRGPIVVWAHVNTGGAVRSLNILGGPGCRDEVTFGMADRLRPAVA